MNKIFWGLKFLITIAIVISIFVTGSYFILKEVTPPLVVEVPEVVEESLNLIFVGDIMLDRGVRSSVYKNYGGDYNQLFEYTNYFESADLVTGNLEGPASDLGRNVGSKYSFRMEPESLSALSEAGFGALSLANNHAGDWTIEAHKDTVSRLNALGIIPLGQGENLEDALTPRVFTKNGISVTLFACSDLGPVWMGAKVNNPGILLCEGEALLGALRDAREIYNNVIIMPHWGDEYVGYNTRQRNLATKFIDNGASAVVGHHPHVVQATEWYKGGLIAYSLGNFIFDQSFSKETMQGMVLKMTVGKFGITGINLYISEQDKTFKPQPLRPVEPEDINTI